MRERYNVKIKVDGNLRRVTVCGSQLGVNATINELMESFEAFKIKNAVNPMRFHAAINASRHIWRFAPVASTKKSEVDLKIFNHVLQRVDQESATDDSAIDTISSSHSAHTWFASIKPNSPASIAALFKSMRQCGQLSDNNVSLYVGTTFYGLSQAALSMQCLSWPNLQLYRHNEAFRSSWSNVIDRHTCHESLRRLVEVLEARIRVEGSPVTYVMKVLVRNGHRHYESHLVYHLLDGKWQFMSGHLRNTKAFAEVTSDQDVSLRVRVRTNPSATSNSRLVAVAKKYVSFGMPTSDTSPAHLNHRSHWVLILQWT